MSAGPFSLLGFLFWRAEMDVFLALYYFDAAEFVFLAAFGHFKAVSLTVWAYLDSTGLAILVTFGRRKSAKDFIRHSRVPQPSVGVWVARLACQPRTGKLPDVSGVLHDSNVVPTRAITLRLAMARAPLSPPSVLALQRETAHRDDPSFRFAAQRITITQISCTI